MVFISSVRLSHKKVNPRLGENCVASFCQDILLLIGLEMLPKKYCFNPRGSTRIDSWIRLLLTAQVLIQPPVNSYWRAADFFVLYEQFFLYQSAKLSTFGVFSKWHTGRQFINHAQIVGSRDSCLQPNAGLAACHYKSWYLRGRC